MTTPTSHLKPELPKVEFDQSGNPKPHDYRQKKTEHFAFCLACLLCRPADGRLDKQPCKGSAKLSLRA